MSYKIYEKQYVDGMKYIARVKLPNGKWRFYPTYQTDMKKAKKVAQRIVKAQTDGEDPNALSQRGSNAGIPRSKQHSLSMMIETYLDEKFPVGHRLRCQATRFRPCCFVISCEM